MSSMLVCEKNLMCVLELTNFPTGGVKADNVKTIAIVHNKKLTFFMLFKF